MAVQSGTTSAPARASQPSEIPRVDIEGISAGILGAATIAIWFFILDVSMVGLSIRPVLSAALFSAAA
jgi:hypothetical protein